MINEGVYLQCDGLRLVPYLPHHVPQYHEWMCDADLLALTESEPLSLQEEEENQQSWLRSMDKLTFILLTPLRENHDDDGTSGTALNQSETLDMAVVVGEDDEQQDEAHLGGFDMEATRPLPCLPLASRLANAATSLMDPSSDVVLFTSEEVQEATTTVEAVLPPPLLPSSPSSSPSHAQSETARGKEDNLGPLPLPCAYVPGCIKCVFSGSALSCSENANSAITGQHSAAAAAAVATGTVRYAMIGDCNLFLLEEEDSDEEEAATRDPWLSPTPAPKAPKRKPHSRTFEVEVMVAEKQYRRRGLAEAAVRMLMQYAVSVLAATRFVAKILDSNTGSLSLFEEKLGFTEFKRVPAFHEVHLARSLRTDKQRSAWQSECKDSGRCKNIICGPYGPTLRKNEMVLKGSKSFHLSSS